MQDDDDPDGFQKEDENDLELASDTSQRTQSEDGMDTEREDWGYSHAATAATGHSADEPPSPDPSPFTQIGGQPVHSWQQYPTPQLTMYPLMPFAAGFPSSAPPTPLLSPQWPAHTAASRSPSTGLHNLLPSVLSHVMPSSSEYHMFSFYPHTPFAGASRMPFTSPITPAVSRTHSGPDLSQIDISPPLEEDTARKDIEHELADGVLEGIMLPDLTPRQRASWYKHATPLDRLQVVLRCSRRCGFENIGELLDALFSPPPPGEGNSATARTVSTFLQKRSNGPRPVDVIQRIYSHPASEEHDSMGQPVPKSFPSIPRHARPKSERLLQEFPVTAPNTTRGDILDWALSELVLPRMDSERDILLSHEHKLTIQDTDTITWNEILSWDAEEVQGTIAQHAPVIFATFSTLSTSKYARKKLAAAVLDIDLSSGVFVDSLDTAGDPVDSDEEGEESTARPGEPSSTNPRPKKDQVGLKLLRDPWLVASTQVLSALNISYKFATSFQTFFATTLFVANAPSRVFRITGRLGLSLGYSTLLRRLNELADDASKRIRDWGAEVKEHEPGVLIVWDNVNKRERKEQTTVSRQDNMHSGTAATAIRLEDVPEGALRLEPLMENIKKKARLNLTVEELYDDIDWTHLEAVGAGTVERIWLKYVTGLAPHRAQVEKIFSEQCKKHALRLRKTDVQSLRCSAIDESTTTGTWQLIRDIVLKQLGIAKEWLNDKIILCCGDQLTIQRIRKVKLFRWKFDSPAERCECFVPVIQLWHMKWAWMKAIFRLCFRSDFTGRGVFGLHHDCTLLGREKFNPKSCDFYPGHGILVDRYEALVLDALRIVCEEESAVVYPKTLTLLAVVNKYFAPEGPLADCSYEKLHRLSLRVYNRYMTLKGYEASQDERSWIRGGFGSSSPTVEQPCSPHPEPSTPSVPAPGAPSMQHDPQASPEPSPIEPQPSVDSEPQPFRSSTPAPSAEDTAQHRPNFTGDDVLMSNIGFMRMTTIYLEFCAGVAEGDIGRVCEALKPLRFSFWGAGSTNYGNELLELACNMMHEFPPALCRAVLDNWLVNPSGLPGHWHELDLLQEHFNYWLKRLFNTKSLGFDSPFLRNVVGLNLRGFCELRDKMLDFFGLRRPGRTHTDADTQADINRLGAHYREDCVLEFHRGRTQPYTVPDEFTLGYDKLVDGQLETFLARTTSTDIQPYDDNPTDATESQTLNALDNDETFEPPNPIVAHPSGYTSLDPFVSVIGALG